MNPPAAPPVSRVLARAACWIALVSGLASAPAADSVSRAGAGVELRDLSGAPVRPLEAPPGRKATVFVFVMHECPVANGYAPEINRIAATYATNGVACHVVYVEGDLSADQARAHARDYSYPGTSLLDPRHQLVKAVGATVSPEAVVVSPTGEVLYRGRIDDRVADYGKKRVQPTVRDLRAALDAVVQGKPVPVRQTRAIGCYIPDDPPARTTPK